MSMNEVVKKLSQAIDKQADKAKTTAYDTPATVRRIEGDTAWVHIPGGVDETPVKMTISAKEGDQVQVRVSGGSAFMVGNGTNPPTDDARANEAYAVAGDAIDSATMARTAALTAEASAASAQSAAASAQADAAIAKATTDEINNYADSVSKTVTQVLADGETAGAAAQQATEAANTALVNLSTVEDVVGVLNWITAHGTMTLTSDVTVNPAHVYFIVDPAGDYVVGGTHYSIVSEPKDAELSTYYELTVDESVQNYVATHLAVDGEGLWIVPDAGGNKVLIATGSGSTYTTAGTYIIGSNNAILASFTANRAVVGNENAERIEMSTDGLSAYNQDGVEFFDVDYDGGVVTETKTSKLSTNSTDVGLTTTRKQMLAKSQNLSSLTGTTLGRILTVELRKPSSSSYSFSNCTLSGSSAYSVTTRTSSLIRIKAFLPDITPGTSQSIFANTTATITCTVPGSSDNTMAIEIQESYSDTTVNESVAMYGRVLSSPNMRVVAYFSCTFSWEVTTTAPAFTLGTNSGSGKGSWSVRAGQSLVAESYNQTAIGKFNSNSANNALEIGNGTADDARSNALTVDWSGNVMSQGMAGMIQMFAGSTAPTGWLICDGSAVSRTDYATLFAVIGTTYGAGDGSTTFNLPNFSGRMPIGVGESTADGHTAHTLAEADGKEAYKLTAAQSGMRDHTHNYYDANTTYTFPTGKRATTSSSCLVSATTHDSSTTRTSNGVNSIAGASATADHTNMPPYLGINFIIATGETS